MERRFMQIQEKNESCETADQALRNGELKLCKTLLDLAPFAAFIFKGERFSYYVNRSAETLTGYSRDELFTMNFRDIVHPDFHDAIEHLLQQGEAIPSGHEIKMITRAGEERWIDLRARAIDIDGEKLVLATAIDISEYKRSGENLKLAEFTVERSADAIFWMTPEGGFYHVNEAACKELGYTREELQSLHVWDIDPLYTKERWLETWTEQKKKGSLKFETLHKTRAGKLIIVEIMGSYLRYDDVEYACAFARDITERKLIDEALEDAKSRAELYLDLMAHDIINMNQSAMGFLEMADDKLRSKGELGREDEMFILTPMDNLMSSSKLIDNVRKLQKEKTGALQLKAVDVEKAIQEAIARFTDTYGRDIAIKYCGICDCIVMANELLTDVFTNLIGNAIKHSSGPLTVNVVLSCAYEDGRKFCRTVVEDNGPGIPDVRKQQLFERFTLKEYRARYSGLGLYLARTLVEDFNGKISVEDRIPGDYTKGSRFAVTLPAIEK